MKISYMQVLPVVLAVGFGLFWGARQMCSPRDNTGALDEPQNYPAKLAKRGNGDDENDSFANRFMAFQSTETPTNNHREEYRALWAEWGRAAPDEAIKFLRTQVPERWVKQFHKDLFYGIAVKYGTDYKKWFEGLSELNQKFSVEGVVSGLCQYSASAIAEWIGNAANTPWQHAESAGWIAKALMQSGGIAKVHKVLASATAPDEKFEAEIFGKAVGIIAKTDARSAYEQLKSCPNPKLISAAALTAALPPLVKSLGGQEMMTFSRTACDPASARAAAIAAWAEVDPDDAGRWLNQNNAESDRNGLIGSFSKTIYKLDPEGALKWAATISDETIRNVVMKDLKAQKPAKR
jgi:hypothetical protein